MARGWLSRLTESRPKANAIQTRAGTSVPARRVYPASSNSRPSRLGIELDENALAGKLGHDWKNPEAYDADDGAVMDW
jgi:hypothetical protein